MANPSQPPLTANAFQNETSVSRETLDRLATYLALLKKWQPRINLVGAATLHDPWRRHFLDSAQLMPLLLESTRTLVDLGSGAGFPGLVLAILGVPDVHLIESDHRKVAFLREAATATETKITVHPARIEAVPPFSADAVTARALAPLASLIGYALPFLGPRGICLFLKGGQVDKEIVESQSLMSIERFVSRSDPSGVVLRLGAISTS
ncbi:MAG: 16S rRNA (guanine(527)-N(7))-methyltransferase RsmG [Rhodospirillaceae bacterium]